MFVPWIWHFSKFSHDLFHFLDLFAFWLWFLTSSSQAVRLLLPMIDDGWRRHHPDDDDVDDDDDDDDDDDVLSGRAVVKRRPMTTVIFGFVRMLRLHSVTSVNCLASSPMTSWWVTLVVSVVLLLWLCVWHSAAQSGPVEEALICVRCYFTCIIVIELRGGKNNNTQIFQNTQLAEDCPKVTHGN